MSRVTGEPRPVARETAGVPCQGQIADRLWAAIPAGMRLSRFHALTVPDQYRDAFGRACARPAGVPCQGQIADRLWAAIPAGMRLSRFHALTVPDQYRDAFVRSSAWRAGIDLSGL